MGRAVDFGNPASVAASRKPGDPNTYLSPLQASCQNNFIVYLTDGEPTYDSDADTKITSLVDANGQSFSTLSGSGTCDAETYPPGFNPSGGNCLDDLAQFLYKGDLSALPDQQNVTTYTIGFTVDLPILADTAARGGGAYYTANDAGTLTNAFTSIVTQILDKGSTFVSPTVAVNSFNRTQNLNDLFVSLFKPTDSFHWPGNLKKYRLSPTTATIVDAGANGDGTNASAAVDPATGFFRDSARSYWSPTIDGNDVTAGGAANLIPSSGNRVVVTNLGNKNLADSSNRVAASNSAITDAMLGTGAAGDPTRADVLAFINNVDVADANGNNSTTDPRDQMGDPLHSTADDRDLWAEPRQRGRVLRDERRILARDRRQDRSREVGVRPEGIPGDAGPRAARQDFGDQELRDRRRACASRSRRTTTARSIPRAKRCSCSSACDAAATRTTRST